jgi:hypothetical protein
MTSFLDCRLLKTPDGKAGRTPRSGYPQHGSPAVVAVELPPADEQGFEHRFNALPAQAQGVGKL